MASAVRPCGAYSLLMNAGETLVSRNDVSVDGICDLLRQALLVFRGDACWIFLCWKQKRICVDNALALHRNFLKKKTDRHQLVLHSGAKDFSGLGEDARNLMQTRDVVLIVLYRVERDRKWKVRKTGMDAVLLADGHLVLFEIEVSNALLQHADQKIVRELSWSEKPAGRDGLKAL